MNAFNAFDFCRSGGIGRRAGFRDQCPSGRVGSSPTFGTRLYPDLPLIIISQVSPSQNMLLQQFREEEYQNCTEYQSY